VRRVVDALRLAGTASRADLARQTGLSRATVSTLVAGLRARGLVVERGDGRERAQQGRPPVLLALDPSAGALVGLDFDHDAVRVAVADLSRTVLAERVRALDVDHAGPRALDLAAELVTDALAEAAVPRERVVGAGLALAGPVDARCDIVHPSSILPGWAGIAPAAEMRGRLGVPVHADNDANLGALAEARQGAGAGAQDLVYVSVGPGIGAGLVVGGRLHHGVGGTAGELGHVQVVATGSICRCGNRGCLETVAAAPAVLELLARSHGPDLTLERVLALAAQDEPGARRAIGDAGRTLGVVLAGVCNVLNPELVVVGGELSAAGEVLLGPLREALALHAIRSAASDVRVVPSALGRRAEVLGALALAAEHARVPLPHVF
jgi:predicted NBD/HSP70 family sugar kinase/biotin operon repressor